jgi:CheY-like chemotaxis protein
MNNRERQIVAVVQDLFFLIKIQEIGKREGFATKAVQTKEDALAMVARQSPDLVILDLNHPAAEPFETIRALKQSHPALQLLGFHPHVQAEAKTAAKAAGCDIVVARSVFEQKLTELLPLLAG